MSRDYKKTYKKRKTPSAATTSSGVVFLAFGLGLSIGLAVAFYLHTQHAEDRATAPHIANVPPISTPQQGAAPASAHIDAPVEPRFTFYEEMPNYELDIPASAKTGRGAAAIQADESDSATPLMQSPYVLQASSFLNREDAERLKAELALAGLEPYIEETNRSNTEWFRVRLGPFTKQSELLETRRLLQKRGLHPLAIKQTHSNAP